MHLSGRTYTTVCIVYIANRRFDVHVIVYIGCVHKLSPGNPGYEPAVQKLITETGLIVYERLVFNRVCNRATLLASRIVRLKMASKKITSQHQRLKLSNLCRVTVTVTETALFLRVYILGKLEKYSRCPFCKKEKCRIQLVSLYSQETRPLIVSWSTCRALGMQK